VATKKVSVVLSVEEYERLTHFCADKGFKKSTLMARLLRDYLDRQGYQTQKGLNF